MFKPYIACEVIYVYRHGSGVPEGIYLRKVCYLMEDSRGKVVVVVTTDEGDEEILTVHSSKDFDRFSHPALVFHDGNESE